MYLNEKKYNREKSESKSAVEKRKVSICDDVQYVFKSDKRADTR